jgi:hypothetical protein
LKSFKPAVVVIALVRAEISASSFCMPALGSSFGAELTVCDDEMVCVDVVDLIDDGDEAGG